MSERVHPQRPASCRACLCWPCVCDVEDKEVATKHTQGRWKVGHSLMGTPAVLLEASGSPHPKGGIYLPVDAGRLGEGLGFPPEWSNCAATGMP